MVMVSSGTAPVNVRPPSERRTPRQRNDTPWELRTLPCQGCTSAGDDNSRPVTVIRDGQEWKPKDRIDWTHCPRHSGFQRWNLVGGWERPWVFWQGTPEDYKGVYDATIRSDPRFLDEESWVWELREVEGRREKCILVNFPVDGPVMTNADKVQHILDWPVPLTLERKEKAWGRGEEDQYDLSKHFR